MAPINFPFIDDTLPYLLEVMEFKHLAGGSNNKK